MNDIERIRETISKLQDQLGTITRCVLDLQAIVYEMRGGRPGNTYLVPALPRPEIKALKGAKEN